MKVTLAGTRISQNVLQKSISVRSNDRNQPSISLVASANITSAVKLEPQMLNFGQLSRDAEAMTKTIKLLKADAGPITPKIQSVGNAKNVKADLKELTPGEEYELTVTIEPPWPNGPIGSTISFQTGIEKSPIETVQVMAQLPPRVVAKPSFLTFNAGAEEEQKLEFELIWTGGAAGHITDVKCSDEALKSALEGEGASKVSIVVPAHFNQQVGKPLRIDLQLDDPVAPTLSIPLISKQAMEIQNRPQRGKPDPRM